MVFMCNCPISRPISRHGRDGWMKIGSTRPCHTPGLAYGNSHTVSSSDDLHPKTNRAARFTLPFSRLHMYLFRVSRLRTTGCINVTYVSTLALLTTVSHRCLGNTETNTSHMSNIQPDRRVNERKMNTLVTGANRPKPKYLVR